MGNLVMVATICNVSNWVTLDVIVHLGILVPLTQDFSMQQEVPGTAFDSEEGILETNCG